VSIGLTHAVAVRHDKTIVSWGAFLRGKAIVPPSGFRARHVAAAAEHDVGLSVTDDLAEWGSGSGVNHAPTGKFSAVGARSSHSIALRKDGTLFGWGGGALATALFTGWTSDGDEHFYVPGDAFVAIAAGNTHTLALRADGTVAGWGNNSGGETTAPAGVRFTAIAAGNGFSIGLDANGLVHYWGSDSFGVSAVPTSGRFQAIGAAARHATAITAK
jgi:alpha-tubulin suppressor-like RCC1 family protein